MPSIITIVVLRHFAGGYITLTSFPLTQLRKYYHHAGRNDYYQLLVKSN